jgi:Protein of unknown function (DUF1214)
VRVCCNARYEFETPIPQITREGAKPYPPTGYRTLDARTNFFYGVTGITPGMAMRVPGIGSQYLFASFDANKQYFDGSKTSKVTLPKGIPEANFWSFTVYDNMTRSMLDTPQRFPRAGSQSYPSPAAETSSDATTTVYFGRKQPDRVGRGNWIQTDRLSVERTFVDARKGLAFPTKESMCVSVRGGKVVARRSPRPMDRSDPGLASVRGWMSRPRYDAKGQHHVNQTYRYSARHIEGGGATRGSLPDNAHELEIHLGAESWLQVAGGGTRQGNQGKARDARVAARPGGG